MTPDARERWLEHLREDGTDKCTERCKDTEPVLEVMEDGSVLVACGKCLGLDRKTP